MNLSGPSLKKFLEYKKIPWQEATVIHDDLDLPLGTVKPDVDRSSGGHLGVQSIIDAFGSQSFNRLRLGIGSNRAAGIPAEDFVIQPFAPSERQIADEM